MSSRGWLPIASAPKTGEHILAAVFDGGTGFGGPHDQAGCAVVHWFDYIGDPAQSGWYPSSGPDEVFPATHWRPLECDQRNPRPHMAIPGDPEQPPRSARPLPGTNMTSMSDMSYYIPCDCGSPAHMLQLIWYPGDSDCADGSLVVNYQLDSKRNLFQRVWSAIWYVLGATERGSDWYTTSIEAENVKKLIEYLRQVTGK